MANNKNKPQDKAKKSVNAEKLNKKQKNTIIISACALAVLLIIGGIILAVNIFTPEEMGTGASEYLETRDTSGHDIRYVEMSVKGYGRMVILLDATAAPKTVEHFLSLVNQKFYNGLTFHKAIDNVMIGGGDPNGDGTGHILTDYVDGEFWHNGWTDNDIKHIYGVISMDRGTDYNSGSCRFFICSGDGDTTDYNYYTEKLDDEYTAFGYVVEGMSVVDKIAENSIKHTDKNGIVSEENQPVIEYIKEINSWKK